MRPNTAGTATRLSRFALLASIALAACEEAPPPLGPSGLPYCWIHDCPTDPGAEVCGTCVHPGMDTECPPGFVCSCTTECVKGPRSYDGGSCSADAGVSDLPDARLYEWPDCDREHLPGT